MSCERIQGPGFTGIVCTRTGGRRRPSEEEQILDDLRRHAQTGPCLPDHHIFRSDSATCLCGQQTLTTEDLQDLEAQARLGAGRN